jgi:hypothetical protein
MFNQKVNYFTQDNPAYLNYSISPASNDISELDIHNCGTTINKYTKIQKCGSLPLQTWCSKAIASESFAMRPIVNSTEYFENIKKYLQSVILNDHTNLQQSNLASEKYELLIDYGTEPLGSLLQAVNLEVTNKINNVMAMSAEGIDMFKYFNPICEGFVVNDINIDTYVSKTNKNHYYHMVVFSAVNTTRYNTVSFRAKLYQNTQRMMPNWNRAIYEVEDSLNITKGINNVNSVVYFSALDLLNTNNCVSGEEDSCTFKGHLTTGAFAQLLNDNMLQKPTEPQWIEPNSLAKYRYNDHGNYDSFGNVIIVDHGPPDFEKLIKDLSLY